MALINPLQALELKKLPAICMICNNYQSADEIIKLLSNEVKIMDAHTTQSNLDQIPDSKPTDTSPDYVGYCCKDIDIKALTTTEISAFLASATSTRCNGLTQACWQFENTLTQEEVDILYVKEIDTLETGIREEIHRLKIGLQGINKIRGRDQEKEEMGELILGGLEEKDIDS